MAWLSKQSKGGIKREKTVVGKTVRNCPLYPFKKDRLAVNSTREESK